MTSGRAAAPPLEIAIPAARRGERLDQALAALLPGESRASVQRLIKAGHVTLEGRAARASYRVRGGERAFLALPPPAPSTLEPEAIPLEVLYEDDDLIVINKPPGMTVHPGAGVRRGTLVHALLHHAPGLSAIGGVERPGIVHRLDRDTSGVIVVARNDAAHRALAEQFKARRVEKTYDAIVVGRPGPSSGIVEEPIGRHPTARVRMAVRRDGRAARTAWRLVASDGAVSLLEVTPATGRTHQIRVHLAHLGHPVLGDPLYGGRRRVPEGEGLALHARALAFDHPTRGERLRFEAARPEKFEAEVRRLLGHRASRESRR
jgi:23S rRNA pseudouridine1911/1915/1917 synthase